jgi:Leucine-rich repeat (LRR) protein
MAEVALAAAGVVLSPFLQVFFERMASREFDDFFRGRKLSEKLLRKLKIALLSVNAVLEDAEDRQFMETSVKEWLHELKDTVYDAEDILDEIATRHSRHQLDSEFGTIASKVRHSISAAPFDVNKIEGKIKDVVDRLEDLAKLIGVLGLRAGVGGKILERLPTTSFMEESSICGRDCDKEAIINSLLSNDARGSKGGVVAITGMGGIGKTTLAQLVYNDDRVKEHFQYKVWVCVSDPFDVIMVMKTIIEAVTLSSCDIKDPNQLQNKLKETLTGKKFLLILDDVWDTNPTKWEVLRNAFKLKAQESRVIVTTRNSEVATAMHADNHDITLLSKDDCWSLFAKYAFHDGNFDADSKLEAIGKEIAKKCKGLPLAIKAIGALLVSKLDVDEWKKVLRSELWDLPIEETDILLALRLSYKYLSSPLKRCFAYCSIFPKDYAFKKDKLILLWMAEGFLPQPKNKTMEEVGDDYFVALLSRSFFQRRSINCDEYTMHDHVRNLAKFISKQFALSLADDCPPEIVSNTRHLSFHENFASFQEAMRLRTVLELNFSGYNICKTQVPLPMTKCLRVLILSNRRNITKLPNSIGSKLIHLRYLELSYTLIKRLPDSICKLCNLQVLNLSHCRDLDALPREMHKLVNLRHLDIIDTPCMKEMPRHLDRLKCLQTLTKFIVGKHGGFGIGELRKLTNLRWRGPFSIVDLQNVGPLVDVKGVNLGGRKYLEELVLEWKNDTNASESQKFVLNSLQPHSNLKSLNIIGYGYKYFPDWVGDASFSNISFLRLENCKFCLRLPPLGQLPSLQDLSIVGLHEVDTVGLEFYGDGCSSTKPFGALKVLRFAYMLRWTEWFSFDTEGGAFPNLRELYIKSCPEIRVLPFGIHHIVSLDKFEILECSQLPFPYGRQWLQTKTNRRDELQTGLLELKINRVDALGFLSWGGGLPCTLKTLAIESCRMLELPAHLNYSSLEDLTLYYCDSLKSFPLDLFPNLLRLVIECCGNLESLDQHENGLRLSLIDIYLHGCPNFSFFPRGGLRAPDLKEFRIKNCISLRSLPNKMHNSSLENLCVEDCPELESLLEWGLPSNLNTISIVNCEKLLASRMGWGLQNLPFLKRLEIMGISEDVKSFPEDGVLPTSLTYLYILGFQNLKSLDNKGLQHLTALEELCISDCPKLECMPKDGLPASLSMLNISYCPKLECMPKGGLPASLFTLNISYCPKLECMPEGGLPASLSTLSISYCPLLKKKWERKEGEEWRKISHVPNKYIDGERIE